ncbi:hypothetical protein MPTK1_1g22080 [Marchantia polymorpha subsp. ruderalis]|nr:hypothetical protein MARPO_0001s0545 [Marchantia polymorpha]BBM99565.1 hypothetical protein Mp_1g22080 [Marchantia polymorpha subsp. ruderalis]|eukprot:PTQ50652.1 hypothetical protein MARPO_0001s0545 [Marchantia polymorpha]
MSSEAKDQIQSGAGESNVTESIKDRAENVMDKLKDNEDHKPQTLGDRVDQMKERQSEVLSGKTSDIHTARPIMPDVGTASDPGEKAARGQAMTNVPEAQDALN